MSTTEAWTDYSFDNVFYIHRTGRYWLFFLGRGWYLFGPGIDEPWTRVDPGDTSPALNLLLASREADARIAAARLSRTGDQTS